MTTLLCSPAFAGTDTPGTVTLLAAGSLRDAFTEINAAFREQTGIAVEASFGPSGTLRSEIEGGAKVDVFASAAVEQTRALADKKLLDGSTTFAYNDLCIVSRPALGLDDTNWLDTLLKPAVRLATSTPGADPMGDYTWDFFRKADRLRPGALRQLDEKALKLSGASAPAPGRKLPYVTAFEDGKADVYVMYCTNAASTKKSVPPLDVVRLPDAVNVRSAYGIGAAPASPHGRAFVAFVLGPAGKAILRRYGFD
jgi:molybdate transport system substrate-binding protein